jgi:hypothetical protein
MNSERIKEIQQATAYPESICVQQALLQVWNECESEHNRIADELKQKIELIKDGWYEISDLEKHTPKAGQSVKWICEDGKQDIGAFIKDEFATIDQVAFGQIVMYKPIYNLC